MNIIETIICGCIGGLTVVLPYIIYMRIRTRRKPATAIGKPIGDRTGAVMPDKKEDLPPDDLKADLYAELNEEAGKVLGAVQAFSGRMERIGVPAKYKTAV